MNRFYPNIEDYLDDNIPKNKEIKIRKKTLKKFVLRIVAETGLSKEAAKEIVNQYFETIRKMILRGDIIIIKGLGNLYISGPKNKTKKRIFLKFKPAKSLLKKMNEDR